MSRKTPNSHNTGGAASRKARGLKALTVAVPADVFAAVPLAAPLSRPADHSGRWSASQWLAAVVEEAARKVLADRGLDWPGLTE